MLRNVIGIDLALRRSGVAGIYGHTFTVDSDERRGVDRLVYVVSEIMSAVTAMNVDLAVVEGYAYGAPSASTYQIGELGGVMRVALHRAGVPFVIVSPPAVKKYATGKGGGPGTNKLAVAWNAKTMLGWEGTSDDEADALWLRAIGLHALGDPVVKVTNARRDVVERLEMPDLPP